MLRARSHFVGSRIINFASIFQSIKPMDPSSHVLSDFNFALSDFNFDAVGDWSCNSNTQSTVKNVKGKNPERIFALDDYSHQPTDMCRLNAINSINGA
jgi:hypothetical protein